jgi:hypothetical protein
MPKLVSCYTADISMNHSTNSTAELDQTDEDFFCEVSDETLAAAAGADIEGQCIVTVGPTIVVGDAVDLGIVSTGG